MRKTGITISAWLAITLLLLPQGIYTSAEIDPGNGNAGLASYIGSYDNETLIHHPQIKRSLKKWLGDEWPHFLRNLKVRGAVDLISGELSLAGNAVHGGGIEEAVLCFSLRNNRASAAIFSQGIIRVYSDHTHYANLGLCIKDWITLVNSAHHDRLYQPDNVDIESQ